MALISASRTELDVINACLSSIGVSAVSTMDSSHPMVNEAQAAYVRNLHKVQIKDWWFNREYRTTLYPNSSGEIELPINVTSCDPVDPNSQVIMVRDDNAAKLYDTYNQTYQVAAIEVVLNKVRDFDELPLVAQLYVEALAVHDFFRGQDGDEKRLNELKADAFTLLAEMQEQDYANTDANNLKSARQRYVRSHFAPIGRGRR